MTIAIWRSLHVTAIGKIERGERRVSVGEASALANVLGLTIEGLLGEDAERAPLIFASVRLNDTASNLQTAAREYAESMIMWGLIADSIGDLHQSDELFATGALPEQTPGWLATGDAAIAVDAMLRRNNIESVGPYSAIVIRALEAERERFHRHG